MRPIHGYDPKRYGAGQDGTVYYRRGRVWVACRPRVERGQPVLTLHSLTGRRKTSVASLVCRAYHGPRPIGCDPLHYPNPDPLDNRADNLRWAPRGSALVGRKTDDARLAMIGRAAAKRYLRALTARQVRWARKAAARGELLAEIAARLGVSTGTASKMIARKTYQDVD